MKSYFFIFPDYKSQIQNTLDPIFKSYEKFKIILKLVEKLSQRVIKQKRNTEYSIVA